MVLNKADRCQQGGTVKTSLNIPAQSFYQSRKTLLDLCDRASIQKIIFYCGKHVRGFIERKKAYSRRLLVWSWTSLCKLDAGLHR